MRRLDRLKYDVEKDREHTLKTLNVNDNAQVVVELKSDEELKQEEQNKVNLPADSIDPNSTTKSSAQELGIDVDETENIRSVIMHKEEDPEFLERFNVDVNWTIAEMLSKLKQFMGIPEESERRLRKELDNTLIVKEELGNQLKIYPEFMEGGVRLKLENGRFPAIEELALTVALYGNIDFQLRFYFKKESTIAEGKAKICKEFGLEPHQYKLWRVDGYEEPQYIVKKERQIWAKNHIANGDFLILKNEEDILPDEQCVIDIHETSTGIPNDCKSIGHVKVKDSDTIDDLKEAILNMEEYRDKTELAGLSTDKVRLRMRSRNMFFGKIYREKNKTLKQLKIKSGLHLVVQFLTEPEELRNNEIILLIRKRDIPTRDYHEFIEFKYTFGKPFPTIINLREQLSERLSVEPGNLSVAKYIPHIYDWRYWDPNQEIERKIKNKKGKGKKGKKNKAQEENKQEKPQEKKDNKDQVELKKLSELDLRSAPFLLSEGDILGVRDDTEEGADKDDFQTEADIENRKKLEEIDKLAKETKNTGKKGDYNVAFQIYTDF